MSAPRRALAIVAVGTELTQGRIANTNAAWISKRLLRLGYETAVHLAVPDEPREIRRAFEVAAERAPLVLVTGGLGPTLDDITREVAAELCGAPLEEDPGSVARIEAIFAALGRAPSPNNRRQALFPRGARVIPNAHGTAPGFSMSLAGARFYFVPGVPRESERMLEEAIIPELEREDAAPGAPVVAIRRLNCFGLPESKVDSLLAPLFPGKDPELAFNVSDGVVQVYLTARGPHAEGCAALLDEADARVRATLGDCIFSEGEASLEETLVSILRERGKTIALAESCTGGLASSRVTRVPGASAAFLGSVVSYSSALKIALLGVPGELIERVGAVSRECAIAMAQGARERTGASFAAAITGVAGPGGGTPEKPVGLVYIAVSGEKGTERVREAHLGGGRSMIQLFSALGALDQLRRAVLGLPAGR